MQRTGALGVASQLSKFLGLTLTINRGATLALPHKFLVKPCAGQGLDVNRFTAAEGRIQGPVFLEYVLMCA